MTGAEALEIMKRKRQAYIDIHTEAQLKKKNEQRVLEAYDYVITMLEEQERSANVRS